MQSTRVTPSPEARKLYGQMIARSTNLCLGLDQTLALAVDINQAGGHPFDGADRVDELRTEGWIEADTASGGWKLGTSSD